MSFPHPPPADEEDARLEARVRRKSAMGQRLAEDERAYLADLPGRRVPEAEDDERHED